LTEVPPSAEARDDGVEAQDDGARPDVPEAAVDVPRSGHGHVHLLRHGPPMSRRAMWFVVAVLVATAAFSVGGMVVLWPHRTPTSPLAGGAGAQQVNAVVVAIVEVQCPAPTDPSAPAGNPTGQPVKCGLVTVRLTGGADKGRLVNTDLPAGTGAPVVHPGDEVVLTRTDGSMDGYEYQINDHRRGTQLWLLLAVFVLAVLAFGRLRGLAALAGLAVTFAILLVFIVPAILGGGPPVLVAIVGSAAIMLSVLYLTHGFTVSTSVAVLGTLLSLTLTGVLSALATAALHLSGISGEEDIFLAMAYQRVDMQGLLLAGILIGSLGVLDDVAVTQAVTVTELAGANPNLSARQLYRAGSRVGRAHITAVINTIILAYAGASLPMLLLLSASQQPLGEVLTTQQMAQEIVRSIVGTIGLIAAVPITTGLAALTTSRLPGKRTRATKGADGRPNLPAEALRTGWLDDADATAWPTASR
jgi:uncharacterized membrane protein